MSQPIVSLRPLTRTDLAAITPWFEDPDGPVISESITVATGFGVRSPEPDCEGMLYYRAARPARA